MNVQGQPAALARQKVPPPRPAYRPATLAAIPAEPSAPLEPALRNRARLHLTGWRASEIATELRYSPHRVSMIVNSPLFEERKAALLRELTGDARAAFLDEIRREAIPNFEFLRAVRDDATIETRVRVRAAQAIADQLDRLLPRDGRG